MVVRLCLSWQLQAFVCKTTLHSNTIWTHCSLFTLKAETSAILKTTGGKSSKESSRVAYLLKKATGATLATSSSLWYVAFARKDGWSLIQVGHGTRDTIEFRRRSWLRSASLILKSTSRTSSHSFAWPSSFQSCKQASDSDAQLTTRASTRLKMGTSRQREGLKKRKSKRRPSHLSSAERRKRLSLRKRKMKWYRVASQRMTLKTGESSSS